MHDDANDTGDSPFWSGADALQRPILLARRPRRIVSLVPSQTELLIDLGVGERLVGRTRYCIHPRQHVSSIPIVGGTKRVNAGLIETLRPDLILAEKEENPREMVDELSMLAPVYVTDVVSMQSAITMIQDVGDIVGRSAVARSLADEIVIAMNSSRAIVTPGESGLYLIWREPWMAAGPGTFIHSCLEHIGLRNAVSTRRYPQVDLRSLSSLAPDRVFLSSEPFPFELRHVEELRKHFPNSTIELVDGELFSWYGSRMLKMPPYWKSLAR